MTHRQPTPGVHENFTEQLAPFPPATLMQVRPGDRFVVRSDRPLSKEMMLHLTENWRQFAGDEVKLLILDKGFDLSVLRDEETPAPVPHLMGPDFGSHGAATAMFDVIAERFRQQEKEGWTPEHDDAHKEGELAQAAAVYAHPFKIRLADQRDEYDRGTNPWPWYDQVDVSGGRGDFPVWSWQPAWLKKTDRRRDLVKAAALIIAEIERLDRAALATAEGSAA